MTKDFFNNYISFNSSTFHAFLEAVLILDDGGKVVFHNESADELFNAAEEKSLQDFRLNDLFTGDNIKEIEVLLKESSQGTAWLCEIDYLNGNGPAKKLRLKSSPIRNGDEKHHGTLVFLKDITAINELEKKNRLLSKFPANNPSLIFQTTLKGKIKYYNPAAENFIRNQKFDLQKGLDTFQNIFDEQFLHKLQSKNLEKSEFEAEFEYVILNFSYSVFHDDDEILISGMDVTHYVALEMENMAYSSHLEDIVNDEVKKVEETQLAAVIGIAKLAETRDVATGKHLERVREYTRVIAESLRKNEKYSLSLTSKVVELIMIASVLHDIGKVGIPDEILLKPGKFTEEERVIMTEHSIIGGESLDEMEKLLKASGAAEGKGALSYGKEIAFYHHERFDGKGYPFEKKGEEIPISARIVSLADVFDALTSRRIYKEAFPFELAMKIIDEGKGTQFDPDVVEAFYNRLDDIKALAHELGD